MELPAARSAEPLGTLRAGCIHLQSAATLAVHREHSVAVDLCADFLLEVIAAAHTVRSATLSLLPADKPRRAALAAGLLSLSSADSLEGSTAELTAGLSKLEAVELIVLTGDKPLPTVAALSAIHGAMIPNMGLDGRS